MQNPGLVKISSNSQDLDDDVNFNLANFTQESAGDLPFDKIMNETRDLLVPQHTAPIDSITLKPKQEDLMVSTPDHLRSHDDMMGFGDLSEM